MKKILLAFDDHFLPEGAFEFARRLNEINPILLTGVFLKSVTYSSVGQPGYFEGLGLPSYSHEIETFSEAEIEKKVEWFEKLCKQTNIEYRTHRDTDDLAIHELKKETRFADLLMMNSESFNDEFGSIEPSGHLKTILHLAECPVLIVPNHSEFPVSTVLAYDGSETSVFAIKQFAYVLPEFCETNVLIIHADKSKNENFPEELFIHELATRHFNDVTFLHLEADSLPFPAWINERKGSLLVAGSFGRSDFSEIFRKSFVADVIREHKMPIFIAHK